MCRTFAPLLAATFAVALGLSSREAWAKPDHLEFLRAAQDRGYGEVAVDFLNSLKEQGALPADLKDTFDLEMCDSLRLSVAEAYNAAEAEKRLDAAKVHLERFLKEHPNHEAVSKALESAADIAFDRGVQQLRIARNTKDKEQQEKFYLEARKAFVDSRPRYAQASQRILAKLQAMKAARDDESDEKVGKGKGRAKPKALPNAKQKKAEVEAAEAFTEWLQARFKVAMVDYHVAQTYTDPADKARKAALDSAAKAFDDIYQGQKDTMVGTYAHMWHGKALDEKGDYKDARDIYDEVVVMANPDSKQPPGELDIMLAQVEYFRFLIVKRVDGPKAFKDEAEPWLATNKLRLKKSEGYQGVQLELGKSYLEAAEKAPTEHKSKLAREGKSMLQDVSKGKGEHAKEALLVLRDLRQGGDDAPPEEAKTFAEAVALGDEAVTAQEWNNAVAAYQQAIEFGTKDKKILAELKAKLDKALFRQALGFYSAGKVAEACAIAEKLAKADESDDAAKAASLAVSCKLTLYQSAQDKDAALKELTLLAEFTMKTWPDKAEADDARIALGQSNLVQGDFQKAIEVFENVNSRSLRYPVALQLAGQTHWRIYAMSRNQPDVKKEMLIAERDKAAEELAKSLEMQRAGYEEDKKKDKDLSTPKQLTDTQLILAEVQVEAGQGAEATALLAPLVEAIKASKPESLDPTMLRTFVAAVKAYLQLGDLKRAGEVLTVLTGAGADTEQVNGVLASFARTLAAELQNANARMIEAGSDNPVAKEKSATDVAGAKQLLGMLVGQIAKRQNNSLPNMIYLAELSDKVGEADSARNLYTTVLPLAEKDPKFSGFVPRLRSNLAGLERQKGNFDAALTQIEAMLKVNPNALEPLMEKGRILQAWGEKDPGKFAEAVNHWASLSGKLRADKPQKPAFFEVNYNAALCLVADAESTQDQAKKAEKAATAGKLLKGLLFNKPKLDGPENVARYKELIKRVDKIIPTANKTAKG